jgi:endothelin-converting enzyme/putative endopeptidase
VKVAPVLAALVFSLPALTADAPRGIEAGDINRSVDACTDFFEYANGAWRAQNPIPASLSRWSRRWQASEANKDRLKTILEEAAGKQAAAGSVDQQIGDFYGSCMDEAKIDKLGVEPLKPYLAQIAGIKDREGLQREIARLHRLGVNAPFNVYGLSDDRNPNDVILYVGAGGLGLPDRDYYVKTEPRFQEARTKYLSHMEKIFGLAGYNAKKAKAAAQTVMKMETALAQHSLDNVALRDPRATDHKMTVADLQKLTPAFSWQAYYTANGLPQGALNANEPEFLKEMDRQLGATVLQDWKTYLSWHLLNAAAPFLSRPFVEEDFAFKGAYLGGAKEMKPRWKRCAEFTDQLLGEALGQKYVEKYFPPEAKARMQELVKNLRLAMGETIQGLDWMTAETKQKAMEKLATFDPKVGYPDKWKDYGKVKIRRQAFAENAVAGIEFNVRDNWDTIGKPVDRGRWGMTPPTSDAYYNPLLNEIVFPAGILQPPAFDLAASDTVNYGAIGVVIGHEISHGFDDQGAQYDAQGRLKNWWTDKDLAAFKERQACVVKQFDGYFVEPGLHHNGKLVLGESIGDLAGARIAYRALQISRRGKEPLPTIDGFTPEQQFFIAWGQFRGDAVRPEMARTMVQGDPHPIGKYRVIGPVSNLPEFAQAFACEPDAPMVRKEGERCEVW